MIFAADIGCKNLAYCILEYKNEELNILEWNLINLHSKTLECCKILRNGKKCCKNGIWQSQICQSENDTINYYCTNHKLIKSKKIKPNKLDSLYDFGRNMYEYLDQHSLILNCDKIVIENQPSLKNPKMKSISMLLYSYFVFHKKSNINFIHPNSKLKIHEKLTKQIFDSSDKKNKYKITKQLGIYYTKYIMDIEVNESEKWIDLLNDKKKQDDLCDSFLHGYFTIFGKNCKENDTDFENYINDNLIVG